MSDASSRNSGGIGFIEVLTIVFIVLKLCEVINWSWWRVLSPLWITATVVVAILGFLAVAAAFVFAGEHRK